MKSNRTFLGVLISLALAVPAVAQDVSVVSSPSADMSSGVMTLGDALATLDEQSLSVEQAKLAIEKAHEEKRQAVTLLYPTVNLRAVYTLNDKEQEIDFGNPYQALYPYLDAVYQTLGPEVVPDPAAFLNTDAEPLVASNRHDVSASLTVYQSLYNARALPFIKQAKLAEQLAGVSEEQIRFTMQGLVTEAYFNACMAKRMVEVAERNLEIAQLLADRATIAFEEGVGNRFETNRAAVELSGAQRELENAHRSVETSVVVLAGLLNIPADFSVQEPEAMQAPASLDAAISNAIAARPELEAHALEVQIQEKRIVESRNRWFPDVFAQFQASLQRTSAFSNDAFRWNIQLGLNWEIFDGGTRTAERRVREVELESIELRREQIELDIATNLRTLWIAIEQETTNIARARTDVELASENFGLTRDARDLGVATDLDVLTAQEQLHLAEIALASAEISLQKDLHEFYRLAMLGAVPEN